MRRRGLIHFLGQASAECCPLCSLGDMQEQMENSYCLNNEIARTNYLEELKVK